MKNLALLIISIISFQFAKAQDSTEVYSITVTINKVSNNNGHVIFSLHDSNTFMKGQGIQNTQADIVDGKCTYTFTNVAPGTYAILALHDANDNKQMDFAASGMPTEDYGTSNNVMAFGPPQFYNAKFEITDKDLDLEIKF